jgi:hypothetical protein
LEVYRRRPLTARHPSPEWRIDEILVTSPFRAACYQGSGMKSSAAIRLPSDADRAARPGRPAARYRLTKSFTAAEIRRRHDTNLHLPGDCRLMTIAR